MTDPWAWLERDENEPDVDIDSHPVSAIVLTSVADQIVPLLGEQTVQPVEIIVADSLDEGAKRATGEWLWLFPQAVRPATDALERLLRTAVNSQRIGLIGPLMLQRQRRSRNALIESCGLTTTPIGRLVPAVEGGEPDQGQLATMAVLGVDLAAALVRREDWQQVGGAVPELPTALAGMELGRVLNSAGRRVVAEPAARVVRSTPQRPDPVEQRSWELRLAGTDGSGFTRLRLLLGSLIGALGFLLAKDPARAGAEVRAIRRWLGDPKAASVLVGRDVDAKAIAGLTPSRRELVGQSADRAAGAVAEAWSGLADRSNDTSLDELTGDDYAAKGRLRRLSPLAVGAWVIAVLTIAAGWRLFGDGRLTGAGLLPSPTHWTDLLAAWLDPVAGLPGLAGPPWLGTTALGALATLGQVEWLVTAGFLLVVPVAAFLALRVLRRLGVDGPAAVIGALGYGITPVLVGAVGGGWLGVLTWALALPLLARALLAWAHERSWRAAGAIGLWLLVAVVEVPLAWPLVVGAMAAMAAIRSRNGIGQVALVVLAGVAGLGQSILGWAAFPGRFLTGASPALAGLQAPEVWQLALARPGGADGPPLWVSAVVAGAAWLAGLLGLFRRPAAALPGMVAAAVGLLTAIGLTRLVVVVPPGVEARPQADPWLVLMLGGLLLAAGRGLSGLTEELRDRILGGWHAAVLVLTAVLLGAITVGSVWWVWDGTTGLQRTRSDNLPAFVRGSMTSALPTRTLAIERTPDEVRWALLEGDLPRLGEDERGLPGSREPQRGLARSVVNRLLSGSADAQLVADLARLGVGHVWLKGSDPDLRTAIGNVPGLGVGTGDENGAVWPVPNAGIATIEGGQNQVTGDGQSAPPGAADRRLVLAQPADQRWQASLDGRSLEPVALPDGRQGFVLGSQGGVLHYRLVGGPPLWPIGQAVAFGVLAILALPLLRGRR